MRSEPALLNDQRAPMPGWLVVPALIVLAVSLPVLLPVVAVMDAYERHRRQRAARSARCARCGQVLGQSGLERGEAAWKERCATRRATHPHAFLRVVRDVYAACPQCDAPHGYDRATRTFPLLAESRL